MVIYHGIESVKNHQLPICPCLVIPRPCQAWSSWLHQDPQPDSTKQRGHHLTNPKNNAQTMQGSIFWQKHVAQQQHT